jgi:hypothetical protein
MLCECPDADGNSGMLCRIVLPLLHLNLSTGWIDDTSLYSARYCSNERCWPTARGYVGDGGSATVLASCQDECTNLHTVAQC